MPDIPVSAPAFSNLQDNVDDVLAEHQNTPNDEIEAAAAMTGVLGVAQSKSVDFLEAIMNIRLTMKLSYVSTTTIQVSTGICVPKKADNTQRVIRKNSSTTNLTGSDLESGGPSFAASTTYYVFASGDGVATTATFKIHTASTPGGLTIWQLIGGFSTNSSSEVIQSTVWSTAGLQLIHTYDHVRGDNLNASTAIPYDNTKPQVTEGFEIFTLTVVPGSTARKLKITVHVNIGTPNDTSAQLSLALFKDGAADAVASSAHTLTTGGPSGLVNQMFLQYYVTAPSASAIVYSVRIGSHAGTTLSLNGFNSGGVHNGILQSFLRIEVFE